MLIAAVIAIVLDRPLVVGYVQNENDLPALVEKLDYARVTHLNVAFENPVDDSGKMSFHPDDDALIKKAHSKGVKVLVSIGGGGLPGDKVASQRYFSLISPPRRAGFVGTLVAYVAAHNFDGLDVDLEGPMITGDYGAFVDDLGKAMKTRGKLLTAALSQGYGGDAVPGEALRSFDFVNVMAYDATGPWAPDRPGQHSSMELARNSVAYWLARGLPKSKTVLGVPFYGYGFGKVTPIDDWPYAKILAAYPGAEKADQVGETIWYNGIPTIQAKAKYILDQGLAGAMIWSLNGDVTGDKSLLKALADALAKSG